MQPKLVIFGQAPVFGKCSECGAIVSIIGAQYSGDSALAEHTRILQENLPSARNRETLRWRPFAAAAQIL